MSLSVKHILSVKDLSKKDVDLILKTAENLQEISKRPIKKVPALRGKTVILGFFESSTRTRASFEMAAKRLSADTLSISSSGSSLSKGESLLDTVRNLEAMNPDLLVVRHQESGMPHLLAKAVKCPVINAGDGTHEHPTQALLDLMTILQVKKKVQGLTVAIIGDILHSRVARSNILLLTKMGAKVQVAGPASMIPAEISQYSVKVSYDIREVIPQADVIMMLRIQREREAESLFPSLREYARFFGLNKETMKHAKKDVVIMHPGPVNRGVEIAPDVADGPHSVILDQVTNGVAVRMALLYLLCGGEG
ncbi:MAG: aspartate carbamoyltransferase [Deltaproteobacteria bacterium RIFCSPLOWO2_01_44_7]|nr:MAG: aspartate carbamoyltransferase [Deltaproteobacteria bacterium RIFCSPHIGHO2_01_FULL_43_49]OGQ15657.1 MAG: aspartate carbamoyltransferase [Deltaproteobacteria bacterium RIFCSPHIGHO2_02_FULL_44_53]OGQ28626.1 MAG: aspartate carbamoyltransferase [Deltaproteobacteria bacterium RIFCSPHIGHO2_12_FULL_44_21]OGQ31948.1 MAG: aspartate carbamoyltransferase [Deltaproteobacteria bacterium RIFCSPLOWO2_01_FULL_45_74]OGQ38790.1 MAG: aspartate carbamoyltransferase [Deltaproteobacteria bacterium RIFCSPLOWO